MNGRASSPAPRPLQPLKPKGDDPYAVFEKFGVVRLPKESEAPILTVATREALVEWMLEINNAAVLAEVGVKPSLRAMLKGPPGTGKTTLAHHVAARIGVPLVIIEISNLIQGVLGGTGGNLGELFAAARSVSGDVALFFDEIDSIAATRNTDGSSAGNERNNTVIALLQMLDRYDGLVFAATNRPEAIDPAVWRRFEQQIEVGLSGTMERFAIVKRYFAPFDLSDDDVMAFADVLSGASAALIKTVVERMKKALVLSEVARTDCPLRSVIERVVTMVQPAADMPSPPLWSQFEESAAHLADVSWPPARIAKKAA